MTEFEIRDFRFVAAGADHTLHCTQYAITGADEIALASVAGPQTAIKSFAAAMNVTSEAVSFRANYKSYSKVKGGGRYAVHTHRMTYNTFHCTVILKDPEFVACVSEESLWQRLKSNQYTTPLLREWMPYIRKQLENRGLLEEMTRFQCAPGWLTLTSEVLDDIVSTGLATDKLHINGRD